MGTGGIAGRMKETVGNEVKQQQNSYGPEIGNKNSRPEWFNR